MSLNLFNILKQVLTEDVDPSDVNHAINTKHRVTITYNDEGAEDGGGRAEGARYIEPYVYGYTKAGNPCLRAYQYNGSSFRGVPKWKLFRLDRIVSWEELDDKFKVEPREDGWSAEKYNSNGDESMSSVENQVSFNEFEPYEPNASLRTAKNNTTPKFTNDDEMRKMIDRNLNITAKEKQDAYQQKMKKQHRKMDGNPNLHLGKGETWNSERVTPNDGETRRQAYRRKDQEKRNLERNLEKQYEKELADIGFDSKPMFSQEDSKLDNQAEKMLHKN